MASARISLTKAKPEDGCVWITGASSGIGRALALTLARDGWRVAVTARSGDKLARLEEEAEGLPGQIISFPGDITDAAAMKALLRMIETRVAPLAVLVANAGVYLPQDGLAGNEDEWRTTINVNLMGTVNVVLPAIEVMKARRKGQIAIVSSSAGYAGLPTSAAYGATKAGLINMAEALKFDLDRAGIAIQVICPGFVDTPATAGNPFPMPDIITVDRAAEEIATGLQRPDQFEIYFPRGFVTQLKLLRLLPYGLYFRLVAKATGWSKKPL
ncbi:SDR family NAD(P)-dependent oxidoreductase [Roseibium suaedae]|uniref:NADP-dependent 3-hydroxy acid dehydrogenase YdfG n=1 Tax=Roseibium suaedae TaxID=735517 RepID=A0A1M7F9L5_9HYPH|nr:SDR family NAD(P)-dependent oxidoreductase [Roseibium suaedae]SHM00741.1 NADP-dependent 3-hydroxy acid dehydrogenase YdfG [Roseibium suaedae]